MIMIHLGSYSSLLSYSGFKDLRLEVRTSEELLSREKQTKKNRSSTGELNGARSSIPWSDGKFNV